MKSALFWTLASRVSIQGFSFLRVVILARILTPYDFGISASTFIAYQLLDMLTFMGFTTALTAHRGNFKEGYPTLWWATFIRGLILAVILFLFSDSIGDFFHDENVSFTAKVIALSFIPNSLTNPVFIVEANRFFEFNKIFVLEFSEALINTISAVILAFYFKDFRAMIYAFLIGVFAKFIISYVLRPYIPKPSFSFKWFKEMLSFGIWVNLTFVLNFLLRYADRTLVGKFAGQSQLGYYSNAQNLAFLVAPQLSSMISRVLFPFFVVSNRKDSERAFSYYLRAGILIGGLFFAPMFYWSEGVIKILLGDKWLEAADLLKPLSLASIMAIISNTISPLSQGKGKPKLDVFRLAIIPLVFLSLSLLNPGNSEWIAWSLFFGYLSSLTLWYVGVVLSGVRGYYALKPLLPLAVSLILPIPFQNGIVKTLIFLSTLIVSEFVLFKGLGIFKILKLRVPELQKP